MFLAVVGAVGLTAGHALMWALNTGFLAAALVAWGSLGMAALRRWVPVRAMLAPLLTLVAMAVLGHWLGIAAGVATPVQAFGRMQAWELAWCLLSALAVIVTGWLSGQGLRHA
ncbi:hypothetical protein D3C72_2156930 [compost metagenome]